MRALLVSSDDQTKEELFKLFNAHFPKIVFSVVETEFEATEDITNQGDIDIIIIDCNDRNLNPSQLSNEVKEIAGDINRIFFGNKSLIMSRAFQNAELVEDNELEYMLYAPINLEAYKELISIILSKVEKENFANSIIEGMDEDFLPMKVRMFYMYDIMPYDVYLKLTKEKYSLVFQQGKSYSHSYIHSYVRKQVRYFYLSKNEHIKALENLMAEVAKQLNPDLRIETKKLIEIQIRGISLVQEYLKLIGITDQVVLLTRLLIKSVLQTFKRRRKEREILPFIDFSYLDSAEKSLLTFKVCESIIRGMRWDAELTKMKLGLASIIHDTTIPNEDMYRIGDVNDPNLMAFDDNEQEKFRTHPQDAAKLALNFGDIPEVDFIIGQHHEMPDGSGFPNKLNCHTLTSLSAIFILANNFVIELYKTSLNQNSMARISKKFEKYNKGNFKEPLKILNDIISNNML